MSSDGMSVKRRSEMSSSFRVDELGGSTLCRPRPPGTGDREPGRQRLRHTPGGGVIQLRAVAGVNDARALGDRFRAGIAPEHVPHIFDRFYKVDASRVAGAAGSGLGLSIAKAIVEQSRRHDER